MYQRRRRYIGPRVLVLSRPFFRYSATRDAFILRGVGEHVGPVLRPRNRRTPPVVTRVGNGA